MGLYTEIKELLKKDGGFRKELEGFIHEWELNNGTKVRHLGTGLSGVILSKHSYLRGTYIVQWEGGSVSLSDSRNLEKFTK